MQKQNFGKKAVLANLAIFTLALVGIFGLNSSARAVDANQVLGQLDANGVATFTQGDENSAAAAINDHGFSFPVGVAVDSTNHRLFVADKKNNRVLVFNLDNNNNLADYQADYVLGQDNFVSGEPNKGGNASASSLSSPSAIVFDGDELLYVADTGNNRVMIFDVSSIDNGEDATNVFGQVNFTDHSINQGSDVGAKTLFNPSGLAFDADRNFLFVSDSNNYRVVVFDVSAIHNGQEAVKVLGQATLNGRVGGIAKNKLFNPQGIAYNSSNKNLAVADNYNSRVVIYDLNSIDNGEDAIHELGQIDFSAGLPNRGFYDEHGAVVAGPANANTLYSPYAVTYNTTDNFLYVSDYGNSRVVVYDLSTITDGEDAVNVLGQVDFNGNFGNQGRDEETDDAYILRPTAGTLSLPQNGYYDNTNGVLFGADLVNNRVLLFKLLKLPTTVLADGQVSIPYNETINPAVNGQGTVRYSVVGNLPNGLSLNAETGAITGIPTVAGHSTFTIKATDTFVNGSTFSDSKEFSLNIVQSVVLPSTALPSVLVNDDYDQTINPAINAEPGHDVTYTVTDGILPTGISLVNGTTGEIAGTPTVAGTYTFTITATDGLTSDSEDFTINVLTLDLSRTLLPSGKVGNAYDQTINSALNTKGNVTYEITAGSLPAGLNLVGREISGTPTGAEVAHFTITATDGLHNSDSADYTITIDDNNFSLPFIPLDDAMAGVPYNQTIPEAINANGTVSYSIGAGLPAGLSFDTDPNSPTFRHILGTPVQVQAAQDFTFDIVAADTDPAHLPDTETFTIHVEPALELPATDLPNQIVGSVYNQTLKEALHARGAVTYSIVAGRLPGGLAFDPVNRVISGKPNVVGTFNFTVEVKDIGVNTYTDTQEYSIIISNPFSLPATVLPDTVVGGTFYVQTLNAATNALGSVTYAVTAGSLPAGFNLAGRIISGNPTVVGTSNFTITATDKWLTGEEFSTSQNYSITINPAPVAPPVGGGNGSGGGGGGGGGGSPVFTGPFAVTIDSIVPNTSPAQVNLRLNGGTATRMAISNTTDFAGISQQPYSTTALWTLTPGTGSKTVYVRFYNSSGVSSPVVSATVTISPSVVVTPPVTGEVLGEKITRLDELVAKLKFGQTNNEVMELQTELKKIGYFAKTWKPTKYYGAMTKAAVQKYLANKNKKPVVAKTLDELVAMTKFGQKSDLVKQLQTELKKLKFLPVKHLVTNYYGAVTKAAVAKYLASKQ